MITENFENNWLERVKIPYRIIYDKKSNKEAVLTFGLLSLVKDNEKLSKVLFKDLYNVIHIKYNSSNFSRFKKSIVLGLTTLEANQHICCEIFDNYFTVRLTKTALYSSTIDISSETMTNILSRHTVDPIGVQKCIELFYQYCTIVYLLKNNKCGRLFLDQIAKITCTSKPTVSKYNKKLVDLKFIYMINNTGYYNADTKTMEKIPNMYSLFENRNEAEKTNYAFNKNIYDKDSHYWYRDIETTNFNRSVTQKYNAFIKNPKLYDHKTMVELYCQTLLYNKNILDTMDKTNSISIKKRLRLRIKNIAIFKDYVSDEEISQQLKKHSVGSVYITRLISM